MANILLVTHWTSGDVFPFIRLGSILRGQGHHITIFTHCYYESFAQKENLEFVAVDTPELFEEMNKDLILLADPINNTKDTLAFNKKYHGKERLLYEFELISRHCDKNTIIISRHRSSISGLLAAEKMNVPAATVFLAPNYLAHMLLHNQLFGKEMVEEINEARRILALEDIRDWRKWLYSPRRFFALWPQWYAQPEDDWPKGIINTGFLTVDNQKKETFSPTITEFLDKHRQVVLITGGSSKMIKREFYQVAAKACECAQMPAILVTYYDEQVPDSLPDSIIRAKNVPLGSLMKKTVAIIHHGGMGTLSEAIEEGIPQIILPDLVDRPDNAQRLAHLGIAKVFPFARWDSIQIGKALNEVQSSYFREHCRLYSQRMKKEKADLSWVKLFDEMVNNRDFLVNDFFANINTEESINTPVTKKLSSLSKQQLLNLINIKRKFSEEKDL